jgi:hypothetical protein
MVSRSIYNLKIDTICMCDIPFDRSILQLSNGIRHVMPSTNRKLELTAKVSMAQPVSQPAVCSNELIDTKMSQVVCQVVRITFCMHFPHLQGAIIMRRANGSNRAIVIQFPAEACELLILQSTHISTGDHPDSWIVCKLPLSCSKTFQPINTHLLNWPCIWFRFSTRMGNLRSHVPTMFWTLNSKNFT